jgi:hypothetical protein
MKQTIMDHFLKAPEFTSLAPEYHAIAKKQLSDIVCVHNCAVDGCIQLLDIWANSLNVDAKIVKILRDGMLDSKEVFE